MILNQQTHSGGFKELFNFRFTSNHDRRHSSIMCNCGLLIALLTVIPHNFGAEAAPRNTTDFPISTTNSYIHSGADSFKEESINYSENHSFSNDPKFKDKSKDHDVRVQAIYNATYDKIQLNVTWAKPSDTDKIYSYNIKLSANSTFEQCQNKHSEVDEIIKNSASILLPSLPNKYEILPGCTYIINITINSPNNVQRNVSNIYYTIPECVGKRCNCINLSPQLKNFATTNLSTGKLKISWEISEIRKNSEIHNITSIFFQYRPVSPEQFQDFTNLTLPSDFNLKSNYLVLNDTHTFVPDQLYRLKIILSNVYHCKTHNFTNFTVTSADNLNVRLENSAVEGKVRNIQVQAIYNSVRNKVLLNVTWEKPLDADHTHSYDFKVSPNDTHPYCTYESFETIKKDKNLAYIYLPPLVHKYEILPGCTYRISIITDQSHLGKSVVDVIYKVPECVGKKCNCKNLTPNFRRFNVQETSTGTLNITWEIDRRRTNSSIYNITYALLEYRPSLSDQLHNNPFRKLFRSSDFNLESNNFVLNDTSIFTRNKKYQLRAIFNNTYNCRVYNYTDFTVTFTKTEVHNKQISSNSWIQILLFLLLSSFIILAVIYILRRNRFVIKEILLNPLSLRFVRRRRPEARPTTYIMVPTVSKRQQEVNLLYVDKEIIDGNVDRYEFPRSRIKFIEEIGEGAFGQVFKARAYGIDQEPGYTFVAVKMLRERAPPDEMDDFLSEIEILKKVGEHPNIVKIFGCCILKEPYLMVMEFVPCRDLKRYLLKLREKWKTKRTRNDSIAVFSDGSDCTYVLPETPMPRRPIESRPSETETEYTTLESDGFPTPTEPFDSKVDYTLDHTELQNFALQIARGMEHLEKIPIAHRDLAARNILIDQYKTLKISDFGLSRVGPYVNSRTKKMPLRWLSLEAIEDHFYDSKGDVWSFAVVLWEIGTLGAFPYKDVMDAMIPYHLVSGKRLPRPEICTDELYSLMLRCWSRDPQLRPSFSELVELLDVKKRRVYVDFNQLNPLYVFPPAKVREFSTRLNSQRSDSTA